MKIVASGNKDTLRVDWFLPDNFYLWETDPSFYLCWALRGESEGSLMKVLRDEGLAFCVCPSDVNENGNCHISLWIALTAKGSTEEGTKRILNLLHANLR